MWSRATARLCNTPNERTYASDDEPRRAGRSDRRDQTNGRNNDAAPQAGLASTRAPNGNPDRGGSRYRDHPKHRSAARFSLPKLPSHVTQVKEPCRETAPAERRKARSWLEPVPGA